MSEWWRKYEGLVPQAGVFYPQQGWMELKSTAGHNLCTYRWPCDNPSAIIFLYHGMSVHANFMAHIARNFAQNNILVLSLDFETHGNSGGVRGRIRNLSNYVNDAVNYLDKCREIYSGLPIFLLGESMGGFISLEVSLRVPNIRGMVLLSPAIGVAPDFKKCLRRILRLINFFSSNIKLTAVDLTTLSRNPHLATYTEEDPLNYCGKMDAGTGIAFLDSLSALQTKLPDIRAPYIIFQGGDDNITDAQLVKDFMGISSSEDKKMIFIEEMRHGIVAEPNINELLIEMIDWCRQRTQLID